MMMTASNVIFLIRFFGGIALMFLVGWIIGHVFKIDEFFKE